MPEIIKNLRYKEYAEMDGVSNTMLNKIHISPAHFKHWQESPKEETEALSLGALLHCLILEPENFERDFAVEPIVNKRTNDGKEILADFYGNNKDKTIVQQRQLELATTLKNEIMRHEIANKLLSGKGENEVALFWADEETGIKCKAKLDRIKNGIIVDLKTTRNSSPAMFAKNAYDYGYHRQAYHYCDGYRNCCGKEAKGFIFIAIEKTPPYALVIYEASELLKEIGKIERDKNLLTYKTCKETDNWFGYDGEKPTINALEPPKWILNKYLESEEIELEEVFE